MTQVLAFQLTDFRSLQFYTKNNQITHVKCSRHNTSGTHKSCVGIIFMEIQESSSCKLLGGGIRDWSSARPQGCVSHRTSALVSVWLGQSSSWLPSSQSWLPCGPVVRAAGQNSTGPVSCRKCYQISQSLEFPHKLL